MTNVPRRPRVLDAIGVAWACRLQANKSAAPPLTDRMLRKGFFIDISQGIERKAFGGISTLCQSTAVKIKPRVLRQYELFVTKVWGGRALSECFVHRCWCQYWVWMWWGRGGLPKSDAGLSPLSFWLRAFV
jgi:hypothetical protein